MGGSDGQTANRADSSGTQSSLNILNKRNAGANGAGINDIMSQYASGKINLQDALAQIKSQSPDAATGGGMSDRLATDATTGSKMAADTVRNGDLTKGLFGDGGIQDQAQGQAGKLSSNLDEDREALKGRDQSYGLNENDLTAYGQGSGNIARMFGSQEQNLAQSLSDRGLASAPSGAAGAEFSGLMGNKNEQLAGLQQQIVQNRINTARGLAQFRTQADAQRQAENNKLMEGLGGLGQQAQQAQFARQMAGSENNQNQANSTAAMNMEDQGLEQNINNEAFNQQQATKEKGFFGKMADAATSGLASDISSITGAPGRAINKGIDNGATAGKSLSSLM